MIKIKVFVDGQEGTTGLKIHERLDQRDDIQILSIDPDLRKDSQERQRLINSADLVFLCLPDEASRESVSLCTNKQTRFIDASTAFRTDPSWVYGFPEIAPQQKNLIQSAMRVSNPGCYATGFIALIRPLIDAGIIPTDYPLSCFGISGYSGAGKKAISRYEDSKLPGNTSEYELLRTPRPYALSLMHKHVPEMQTHCKLQYPPTFTPIIADYAQGMLVHLHLLPRLLNPGSSLSTIHQAFGLHYSQSHFVRVLDQDPEGQLDGGFLNAQALNNTNFLDIMVHGNDDRILLSARLDNLGKGASGAAIQSMNIMFNRPENLGLI